MGHLRLIALAAFACASATAAASGGLVVSATTTGSVVRATATAIKPGTTTSVRAGGGVDITDAVEVRTPQGRAVAWPMRVELTPPAAARLAARLLPIVGTAALAYEVYDALRVRPQGDGLAFDPGADQVTEVQWRYRTGTFSNATPGEYIYISQAAAALAVYEGTPTSCGVNCTKSRYYVPNVGPGASTAVDVFYRSNGVEYLWFSRSIQGAQVNVTGCPADPVTGFRPPVDWDGKCPTGTWLQPMTEEEAALRVFTPGAPPISDAAWKEIMDDVLGRITEPVSPSGLPLQKRFEEPAPDVDLGTTTRTDATGTTTEQRSVYGIPYAAGEQATGGWADRLTRTRTDPEGNPIGSPEVETSTPAPPTTPTPDRPTDQCDADPGRIGCLGLGDPPEEAPQWSERTVDFASESLGLPAACPASHDFSIRGWSMQLNYTPACDVAPLVRAGVLALTALACAFFVLRETRS